MKINFNIHIHTNTNTHAIVLFAPAISVYLVATCHLRDDGLAKIRRHHGISIMTVLQLREKGLMITRALNALRSHPHHQIHHKW